MELLITEKLLTQTKGDLPDEELDAAIEKEEIEFDEKNHLYKLDGIYLPSVTQIITETTGTAWKAAQWYLDRGKAIHACAAFIAQGKTFKFDERLSGYIRALKKFFNEVKPTECKTEIKVASKIYKFLGTLDLACRIKSLNSLIDYKHNCDKNRIGIQLGGYSQAYKETYGIEINNGYGVEIHENGTYCMTPKIDLRIERNKFLALRTTYSILDKCGELSFQKKEKAQ